MVASSHQSVILISVVVLEKQRHRQRRIAFDAPDRTQPVAPPAQAAQRDIAGEPRRRRIKQRGVERRNGTGSRPREIARSAAVPAAGRLRPPGAAPVANAVAPSRSSGSSGLALDAALTGEAATAQDAWSGLGHLEGYEVGVLADGAPRATATVGDGAVVLDPPAATVQVGLVFRHEIEPLPPDLISPGGAATGPLRLVAATFRLLDTAALSVDLGRGAEPVPFRRLDTALLDAAPARFTGDVTLRGLGWRRDRLRPIWRIEGDAPLPMTLLSVTTEIRMTD